MFHLVKLDVLIIVNKYLKMLRKCISQKIREFFHGYFPGILYFVNNFLNDSQPGM